MPLSLFHLHGDLKDLRFPRLLAALRDDDFTGVFQATIRDAASRPGDGDDTAETTREVHFSEGHIAWAISTNREESLRCYLMRNGAVTQAQWDEAEERAREGTLRQALIGLGLVSSRELNQIEKGRVEEIVLALFSAREGEYRVRERQLAPGTPDLKIDPRPLILKGVLEGGDRALILDEVGSLDTVYVVKRPVLEEPCLSLPGEFQSVLRYIDGRKSIARICSLTSLPDNFVCSVFAALSMIGAVRRNYEKTQAKGRSEIVRGLEVAHSLAEAPAPVSETDAVKAAPRAEPVPAGLKQTAAGVGQLPLADLDLPPITTTPFPGEGPVTTLETVGQSDQAHAEQQDDETLQVVSQDREAGEVEAVEEIGPEDLEADRSVYGQPSVYGDQAPAGGSRPWFLLGGAAAVGFAALFLILMAQNPGDAGEVIRPVSEAALSPPQPASAGAELLAEADVAGTPEPAEKAETGSPERPSVQAPPGSLATPPGSNILTGAGVNSGAAAPAPSPSGRQSLILGDYLSASRYFGREVSGRPSGGYTIQLLTACQDTTIKRAVENAGGSSNLFILSTRLDGRNCYRVYWGRYPSQIRAREALRREVPASLIQDQAPPRITRLGGS